ncbi:DNA-binding CsgD family transcriptional regulator [Actinoplanes lutulentus]|uniref:Putative ATPase n=1 Tax=Actinoplanes lutulentus TaxID=1287878 RepID=A0A327Z1Q2_9ACTN|nr:LuxR family transcriptional regulator [Actinoplanes lutulentus]MBB2943439.1 DNA-binding CsgD family transcriptional regulator [Actinoplanes lutulentus]RAK26042.1 putative ATPase [Actinoplanes lutulentus]
MTMTGLIGRDHEIEDIRAFLAGAARDGGTYLISGAAGVGKTVLLDAAAHSARTAGELVLRAGGVQFEADVSYSSLHQLLTPLLDDLGDLQPHYHDALTVALGIGSGPPPPRLALLNAVLTLLGRAAAERPVLLVVDDLPWLDRASAVLLSSVARRLGGTGIGLLGASRSATDGFFEPAGLPEIELHPLGEEAASELLATRFPTLVPGVRRRLLLESQGNPLALMQLPATLTDRQRQSASILPAVLPLTGRLQALFAERIDGLPAATRAVLLRAVLDGTGDLRLLADERDDLAPAEAAQLITREPATSRLSFRHPLIRSSVVDLAGDEDRRQAHQDLAARLLDQPDRRVWHLAEAATGADEQVAALLEHAAHRTLHRGDATGAVTALTRAAALSPARQDQSRRLAVAAYVGANTTGEMLNASELLDQARRLDPAWGGSMHAAMAATFILINGEGDLNTAYRLLVGAIEAGTHGYAADDEGLIDALSSLLLICYWLGRAELWPPFYAALDRLTPAVPELLLLQSRIFPDPARTSAAMRARFVELIKDVDAVHEPSRITRINTTAAYLDLLGATRDSAWRLVHDGRSGGAVRSSVGGLMYLCIDDFFGGRWDECADLAAEGLARCRANGYGFNAWYALYIQALLAAVRGDQRVARERADEHIRLTEARSAPGAAQWAQHPRVLAAIAREDYEDAYRQAVALGPAGTFAAYVPHALWVSFDLVEAAVRTGRHREAADHVAAMHRTDLFAVSPRLMLLRAGAAAVADRGESALAAFEEACATPGAGQWPLDLARLRLLYGERLRRARRNGPARAQLNEALETFERLGAVPWIERARRELRAAGEGQPRTDAETLTAQELEIARLAAEGLTNRQIGERLFLSHRTVGAHLYRLYPKLGITNRTGLHAALAGRGQS